MKETHDMNWSEDMLHQNVGYSKMKNRTGNGDISFLLSSKSLAKHAAVIFLIPVSVGGVKVGVWPQAGGAGTPHPVQRWLQVTAQPRHGSREGKKQEQDGRKTEGKNKTRGEASGGREVERDMRQCTGDEEDRERRRHRVKKEDSVRIKSWREKRRGRQTER